MGLRLDRIARPRLMSLHTDATADRVSGEYIVDALLRPSKVIRRGFETTTVLTTDGRTVTGIVESREGGGVALRDPATGNQVVIAADDVDAVEQVAQSIMPEGLVGQLTGRQQFLDLVRYLLEVRDGGELRARELQPAPSLYASRPLPDYEDHIDHTGMIRDLDDEAFDRGEAIYERLCINCHDTPMAPGSLPTSLKFASGEFRGGSDPFSMYQTLTRGFGLMVAQRWMVPQQKYDVVHYIREAYLRPHNPSQYVEVTDELLAALPVGDTRGPEPAEVEPWEQMDYGPNLIATYEIGDDATNFALQGQRDSTRCRSRLVSPRDTIGSSTIWTQCG